MSVSPDVMFLRFGKIIPYVYARLFLVLTSDLDLCRWPCFFDETTSADYRIGFLDIMQLCRIFAVALNNTISLPIRIRLGLILHSIELFLWHPFQDVILDYLGEWPFIEVIGVERYAIARRLQVSE